MATIVISSTSSEYTPGQPIELEDKWLSLKHGESTSDFYQKDGKYYAVGITCSRGYREYKSESDAYTNDVFALTFLELGASQQLSQTFNGVQKKAHLDYDVRGQETLEFATFYVGESWFGIKKDQMVEAVRVEKVTPMPGLPRFVKGTILFKGKSIYILSAKGISSSIEDSDCPMALVFKTEQSLVGLMVSSLGEIPEVPISYIHTTSDLGSIENSSVDSIVRHESSEEDKPSMLLILNTTNLVKNLCEGKTLEVSSQEKKKAA